LETGGNSLNAASANIVHTRRVRVTAIDKTGCAPEKKHISAI
jgi:hypothetical protein